MTIGLQNNLQQQRYELSKYETGSCNSQKYSCKFLTEEMTGAQNFNVAYI